MRKSYLIIVVVVLLTSILSIAWADPVVREIYYQKKTTLASKSFDLRFSLWDAETGGGEVWSEEKGVTPKNGIIKTYLGDTAPLDGVDFSSQLWVQVERIKKDGTPIAVGTRDMLAVVPYALYSEVSAGGGDGSSLTGVTAGNGLTGGGTFGNVTLDVGAGPGIAVDTNAVSIATGGVTTTMLADNAVTSAKIADSQIGTNDLANGAVTTAKISSSGASSGQVLKYNGTSVTWDSDAVGGFTLPYNSSVSSTSSAFKVTNNGAGVGIEGAGGSNSGLYGTSSSSAGVVGYSDTGTGAQGVGGARGIYGFSNTGEGVYGLSAGSVGVLGASVNSVGVRGTNVLYNNKGELATAGEGVYGVSTSGDGVKGESSGSGTPGVRGVSTTGDGVRGESSGSNKSGVYGVNNQSDGYGVYGRNTGGGYGVYSNGSLRVDGDIYVTGAYKGGIGPNGGAPFPRPAYDSGWVNIPGNTEMLMDTGLPPPTYSNDNFFIYLRGKVNNWEFVPFADLQAEIESDNKIEVYNSSSGACQFRLQVWYIN